MMEVTAEQNVVESGLQSACAAPSKNGNLTSANNHCTSTNSGNYSKSSANHNRHHNRNDRSYNNRRKKNHSNKSNHKFQGEYYKSSVHRKNYDSSYDDRQHTWSYKRNNEKQYYDRYEWPTNYKHNDKHKRYNEKKFQSEYNLRDIKEKSEEKSNCLERKDRSDYNLRNTEETPKKHRIKCAHAIENNTSKILKSDKIKVNTPKESPRKNAQSKCPKKNHNSPNGIHTRQSTSKQQNNSSSKKEDSVIKSKSFTPIESVPDIKPITRPNTSDSATARSKNIVNNHEGITINTPKEFNKIVDPNPVYSETANLSKEECDSGQITDTQKSTKVPKISLIPLSKLLRIEDFPDTTIESQDDKPLESLIEPQLVCNRGVIKPNLVLRRRKQSSCSSNSGDITEALVDKVVSMDKMGIKNIINSIGTKYDEALKLQARKRLHDEIRKQLKTMNVDTPKESGTSEFVPDDIVDAIHIPDVVFDEIRKAFGINIAELSSNKPNEEETLPSISSTETRESNLMTNTEVGEKESVKMIPSSPSTNNVQSSQHPLTSAEYSPRNVQLIVKNKVLTSSKSADNSNQIEVKKSNKIDKRQKSHKTNAKRKKSYKTFNTKGSSDVIVIQSSSSSSNSSSSSSTSSSSSSSDSDSDSNQKQIESQHTLRQKSDAENVVANFEKLVLSSLSESLRTRYETKYSNSTYSKLHFISCICASDYNSEKVSKTEIAKIQKNLKSSDKSMALLFLMREIMNVFNKQKSNAKTGSKSEMQKPEEVCSEKSMSHKESSEHNRIESGTRCHIDEKETELVKADIKSKSANAAENSTATTTSVIPSTITSAKTNTAYSEGWIETQSTPYKHQSANEQTSMEKNAGNAQVMSEINKSRYDIEKTHTNSVSNDRQTSGCNSSSSGAGIASAMAWPPLSYTDYVSSFPNISEMNEISSLSAGNFEIPTLPCINLETLRKQSPLGEAIAKNLQDIDLKLMELHKRKIFIGEMLLRLQKDKMEVELLTIKLQNEKFILLNSATNAAAATIVIKPESTYSNVKTEILYSDPATQCIYNKHNEDLPRQHSSLTCSDTGKRARHEPIELDDSNDGESEPWSHSPKINEPRNKKQKTSLTVGIQENIAPKKTAAITKYCDYSQIPIGYLEDVKSVISHICILDYLAIAGSEDGSLYKFNLKTLQMVNRFNKHSEAITHIHMCAEKKILYTTSLDGYFKKTSIENFELDIQSLYLQEPLQSIDIQWNVAYIGSRWGNIFTYDMATNQLADSILCSIDASITAIKATKEGARKILIISSKGNVVQLRDATSGILLRTLDVPEHMHVYSLLLHHTNIYCGTQCKEILKFDLTSGNHLSTLPCGNGAISIKLCNNKYLLVGCYDGYIYVLDQFTEKQVGRFPGSGKMVLAMEVMGNKIITSSKNKTMKIIEFSNIEDIGNTELDPTAFVN